MTTTTGRPLATIVVPASTSNLGAGFDALGLALSLTLVVEVMTVIEDGLGELRCTFTGTPPYGDNLIATGYTEVARHLRVAALPSLDVRVTCDIPPGAGLGSSAAALVAGGRLAALVVPGVTTQVILEVATDVEGHPDNVAASLYGGLVASLTEADGTVRAVAMPWPTALRLVVATPEIPLATRTARAVLPMHVPRADAVFNLQRVAVLLGALATNRFDVLRAAFADRLHQPHRLPLVPGLDAALHLNAEGLVGVFLSGAGPSIAAVAHGDPQPTIDALRGIYARLDLPTAVRVVDVHQPTQDALTTVPSR
jgi:homoserine kinase